MEAADGSGGPAGKPETFCGRAHLLALLFVDEHSQRAKTSPDLLGFHLARPVLVVPPKGLSDQAIDVTVSEIAFSVHRVSLAQRFQIPHDRLQLGNVDCAVEVRVVFCQDLRRVKNVCW